MCVYDCGQIWDVVNTGIVFEAYSPLGNPARPMKSDDEPADMDDPVIKEIAGKYNASPAQVSWCLSLASYHQPSLN